MPTGKQENEKKMLGISLCFISANGKAMFVAFVHLLHTSNALQLHGSVYYMVVYRKKENIFLV
jgi:hypothetical protein